MGIEIERKFLVDHTKWFALPKSHPDYFIQGYLHSDEHKTIRVRATIQKGFITIKGKSDVDGISRSEYEYEIPRAEAIELLSLFAETTLEKNRYEIAFAGNVWEVDVFEGKNKGLIVAEIELKNATQSFEKPDWITEEVTGDKRYYNSWLAVHSDLEW